MRLQQALDAVVAAGVPGAIVLVRDGDRTIRLASGYGNLARRTPMRASDRFRVGSETKMFVATVVLQLGFGLLTMLVAAAALLVVVPFSGSGLVAVLPPLALLMFNWSFVNSNAVALALTDHPAFAGTAAALLGVSQFAFGAALVPLVGIGGNDTALPMAAVIATCGVGALLAFRSLVPPAHQGQVTAARVEA